MNKVTKNIPLPTYFGQNLRFLRKLHKIGQKQLAETLGLNRNNISSYEIGKVEPSAVNFLKICDFFGVEPEFMLSLELASIEKDLKIIKEVEVADDHIKVLKDQNDVMLNILKGHLAFKELSEKSPEKSPDDLLQFYNNLLQLFSNLLTSNNEFISEFNLNKDKD